MSLLETTLVAARDRKRLGDILSVLAHYGIDDLFSRFGLVGLIPKRRTNTAEAILESTPERLRLAIEQLGPTFIKLGQILSTRADLLEPEWITEFEKLQSHVPPLPWETIRDQVEDDLGGPVDRVFAAFDTEPLAAGSIAQVHAARLQDGQAVVVKVRRAGLRPMIEADLRLLSHIAGLVEAQWPQLSRYRPREILHHLGLAMSEELDLAMEGRNARMLADNLADLPDIVIPRIHDEWTRESLLVQDFIDGIEPGDTRAINAAGLDGALLAARGAEAFLRMALIDGFFHADPHPGNLRALPDNRVAFIDFGMVGRLGSRRREQLLILMDAIINAKGERVSAILLEWSGMPGHVDLAHLDTGCDVFVSRHGVAPLRLGEAITDLLALAREHDLTLPSDLALLFKALITADGVMRSLDAEFDVVAVAAPLMNAELRRRYAPGAVFGKGRTLALDVAGLAMDLPSLVRLLMQRLKQGRITAEIELKGLEKTSADIRWAATRVAVAIVTAAFALGLAPHLLTVGPTLFGIPITALFGMGIVTLGVVWLLLPRRR